MKKYANDKMCLNSENYENMNNYAIMKGYTSSL